MLKQFGALSALVFVQLCFRIRVNMFRKPVFWIFFVVFSVAAAVFALRNFSAAFPLVSINLQMDREAALAAARMLAEKNAWPPGSFDQAAEFSADQEVQNFIELEGGGKQELGRILKETIFAPYTWRVRHFKEGDAHETLVRFTPEGKAFGFRVQLPEQEAGDSISADVAQGNAETAARQEWNVDFNRYRLAESSKEIRPGGRTDHTFVYERQDERLREGSYRLRLVIGGNKLTELTYYVQIPEAFSRRYEEMRSANTAITAASSVATFVFYILGCCGIGLFFMMRRRWVLWWQAAFWGVFIALLMGLDHFNSWSLLWMGYDTAVPASGFAIRQIATAIGIFGGLAALMTVSFMAAETLSRRAFPHHIQFWKIWSAPVAASKAVFGQTLCGYLLVSVFFAYEIVLYFFAQGKLGWWTPSDTLVNPNIFASYLPFLSAIAQAAQAGFWEECLFRAAPLATAALIGDRFGHRRTFLIGAMILQTFIFASGHAGYANQPAYARVVELIIPSLMFGGLYLIFGLLPGIVLHYTYDTVWMSLPLFVSSSGRARFEQIVVILLVLVPLWAVLAARLRSRRWMEMPAESWNGAWKPLEIEEVPQREVAAGEATLMLPLVSRLLPYAGLVGLIVWVAASSFQTDAPPISITRFNAEAKARQALAGRGIQLDSSWTVLSRVEGQPGQQDRFVWQNAGPQEYARLMGSYLTPPHWRVRFARFQGDVAERAEEYQVFIDGGGKTIRVTHELPEARPGKNLTVDEARLFAQSALTTNFQLPIDSVKEISAEARKRPARGDWAFVFSDTRNYGLPQGEPRISIEIAGDEVVDAVRYVYVPEEWARNERGERNLPAIFAVACTVAIIGMVLAGAVVAIVHWSRKRGFSVPAFFAFVGVLFLLVATNLFNNWPVIAFQLSTAQPLMLQAAVGISVSLVVALFRSVALALAGGLVASSKNASRVFGLGKTILMGAAVGGAMAGLSALARLAAPSIAPNWGSLDAASMLWPMLGAALTPLNQFLTQALLLLLLFLAVAQKPRWWPLLVLAGLILAGPSSLETISSWLITGVTGGIVLAAAYVLVLRHQPKLVVTAIATLAILSTLRDGLRHSYPGALIGSIAAMILIGLAMWVWLKLSMHPSVQDLLELRNAAHPEGVR